MAAAKKSTNVAKKGNTDVVEFDFGNDAGAGMEGADADSFAVPFLGAIQTNSPYVIEGEAKFIEAAKAGMLINTVTEELFDGKEGILFVPCAYQRRFIRWGARKQGGGFKGEYTAKQVETMREAGEVKELDGRLYCPTEHGVLDPDISDNIKDTRNHFGMIKVGDTWQNCLLSLASTQIKKSKALMTMLDMVKYGGVTPPTWFNVYRVTTVPESNDEGNWYGVKFTAEGNLAEDREAYDQGKSFHDLVAAGEANVNYNQAEEKESDAF